MLYNYSRSWQKQSLPPENPTWGFFEITIGLFSYVILKLVFNWLEPQGIKSLALIIKDVTMQNLWYSTISILLINVLILLIVILLTKKSYGTTKELGISSDNFFKGLLTGVLGGLIVFTMVIGSGLLLVYLFNVNNQLQQFAQNFLVIHSGTVQLIFYFIALGLVPITQAVLFQGFIYPVFRSTMGKGIGLILTALIFAISFFHFTKGIPLFIAGLLLTYLYEKAGSLLAPIIASAIWQGAMLWLISFTSGQ